MDILFLGTAASLPSRARGPSCIAVRNGADMILLDCGEGSQRQLMISPFSFMKITGIFISHMHGDHVLGLPGLLQTMSLSGRKAPLTVCGPCGFSDGIGAVLSVCEGEISYPLNIRDMEPGEYVEFKDMVVSSFKTEHNISSLGFILSERDKKGKFDRKAAEGFGLKPSDFSKLQKGNNVGEVTPDMVMGPSRPGLRIAYSGDTSPCKTMFEAISGVDLLIHEATYCESEKDLAKKHWHSTVKQAAEVAKDAGCRALILTHVSNRYGDRNMVESEARSVFEESYVADDMKQYILTDDEFRSV